MSRAARILPMPPDTAVLLDYGARTFWALLVVVITLLFARGVRRATMRMLARSRAQANVTILLGNLAQVVVILLGILGVLAIYTRDIQIQGKVIGVIRRLA